MKPIHSRIATSCGFLVGLAYIAGCTSTHVVDSSNPEPWIPTAREQLLGEDVEVRTIDGRHYSGMLILLSPDSVKLKDSESDTLIADGLPRVIWVGEPTNAAGPILGCIGGVAAGGTIGVASVENALQTESMVKGITLGAVIGGLVGVTIGGFATKADQYEIHQGRKSKKNDND